MLSTKTLSCILILTVCFMAQTVRAVPDEIDEGIADGSIPRICGYAKYCQFCDLCDTRCPCEMVGSKRALKRGAHVDNPNCGACKYCKFCPACTLTEYCVPGGKIATAGVYLE